MKDAACLISNINEWVTKSTNKELEIWFYHYKKDASCFPHKRMMGTSMETRVARCYSPSYCSQFQLRRELKWKKETADQRLRLDREGVSLLDATEVGLKNIILCCGLTSIILLWFLPSAKIAIFIWELQLLFRSVWRKITEFWRRNLQKERFLWVVCQDRGRT